MIGLLPDTLGGDLLASVQVLGLVVEPHDACELQLLEHNMIVIL